MKEMNWNTLSKRQPFSFNPVNTKYEVLYNGRPAGKYMFWDDEEKAFCYDDLYLLKSPKRIKWKLYTGD